MCVYVKNGCFKKTFEFATRRTFRKSGSNTPDHALAPGTKY